MFGTHEAPACGVVLIGEHTVVVHQKDFIERGARFVLDDPRSKAARDISELVPVPESVAGRF